MTEGASDDSLLDSLDRHLRREPGREPMDILAGILAGAGAARAPRDALQLQGTTVGGWRLTRLLGTGGMGVTFAALRADGATAAVKIVDALSEAETARFESEAAALASLDHPGIARYLGHGRLDGSRGYLVMEHVDGPTLEAVFLEAAGGAEPSAVTRALLEGTGGPSPGVFREPAWRRRLVRLLAGVADALEHAHAAGIVHRDVKPSNILIRNGTDPVVIDFGLSRDLFRGISLTRSGAVLGTLSYMAPEQLRGGRVDARADVHALGLLLFRAVTGRDLRADVPDILRDARHPFLLSRRDARDLDPGLQAVLYRCLETDPRRRYPSAALLASDLRAASGAGTVSARRPAALVRFLRTTHGPRVAAASVLFIVAVLVGIFRPATRHALRVRDLFNAGEVYVDGDGRYDTPLRLDLEEGRYEIEVRGADVVPYRRHVDVGGDITVVHLATICRKADSMQGMPESLPDRHSLLRIHCGDPRDRVSIDGEIRSDWVKGYIAVAPGKRRIEARNPDAGLQEVQMVEVPESQILGVHLLPRGLRNCPGRVRITLGNALAPLPPELSIRFRGGAGFFRNTIGADRPQRPAQRLICRTCVTPWIPERTAEVVLNVDFAEPVTGIRWSCEARVDPGRGEAKGDYRLDAGAWRPVPADGSGNIRWSPDLPVPCPSGGVRRFELRFVMTALAEPAEHARVEVLSGWMDKNPEDGWDPCFAIVAEPVNR